METPEFALCSLKIRGFRGIDALDLDFRGPDGKPNPLVVLCGPNGGGKTTVLDAIHAALVVRGRTAPTPDAIDGEIALPGRAGVTPVEFKSDPVYAEYAPRVEYAPHREGADVFSTGSDLFAASARGSRDYAAYKARVDAAWATLCPGDGRTFAVEFPAAGSRCRIVATRPDSARGGLARNLSAGQRRLFGLLAVMARGDSNAPGVVLMDDVDATLDEGKHRTLVRVFRALRPNAQFILATRSAEVYAEAKSYERHYLVAKDDPRVKAWIGAVPLRDA